MPRPPAPALSSGSPRRGSLPAGRRTCRASLRHRPARHAARRVDQELLGKEELGRSRSPEEAVAHLEAAVAPGRTSAVYRVAASVVDAADLNDCGLPGREVERVE